MSDSMVERVARAMRRRRFERTGRLKAFDADTQPTDNEMDDAIAAIEAMRGAPAMSEQIPDDVMKRARLLIYETIGAVDFPNGKFLIEGYYDDSLIEAIASALMEEQERCAKIAEGNDHFPAEGEFIASLIRGTDAPSG